jgi:type IV pilus assembly protein PilY1
MTRRKLNVPTAILAGALAAVFSYGARAQTTTNDDFTQANDMNSWQTFDGACLTAGDGTGNIPSCIGLPYYGTQIQLGGNSGYLGGAVAPSSAATQIPDPPGKGALRFTNWYGQAGSIISSGTPFPSGAGLQVIFKTVTYLGDSGGGGADGADGIGFFLMDGGYSPYDTGAFGGSLGYTCSNANNDSNVRPVDGSRRGFDGLAHAYLGLGIDEYGNFLNSGDNTASGDPAASGVGQYQPGRIGLRGAGSIAWAQLNALDPAKYPSSLTDVSPDYQRSSAVQNTCRSGFLWDYSNLSAPVQTTTPVLDYPAVPGAYTILNTLLPGQNIANEAATTRSAATPITYNLQITQNGLLSLYISYGGGTYLPVITAQSITALGATEPSSFRFGFTGSTGGSRNIHEILCFQATPNDVAGTSVGVNEQAATKVASGVQAYLAYYYPSNDTGRLTASDLQFTVVNGVQTLGVAPVANWDASCNLTGIAAGTANACPTTTVVGPVPAQPPAFPGAPSNPSRNILTWNGSSGVPFEWNSITTAQQNTLDQGDVAPINANRLNYLRGDRTNEITPAGVGLFRARTGVLGDIIDSSPTWVGPPSSPYSLQWKDLIHPAVPTPENTGTQSYTQYLAAEQTRLNVVYNGANDGFLHAFRTGSFDVNGNYVNTGATPNDGLEVLAYMPGAVLQSIHNAANPTLDYSNPQYSHNFFVDATPDQDELFYNGMWHTWLVGGLGAGGAAIYALDITTPANFSEANASTLVMGEWTPGSISCINVANCGNNLGNTYGTPVIRRLHDGNWGIIFGNGFGSVTGDAGIYVMVIDGTSGAVSSTYYLSTGTGTGTPASPCTVACDGIAYVSPADLDGDHITDFVYAGDLKGNVWRFDLTGNAETSWAAAATPLFTVPSGAPITTSLQLAIIPATSTSAQRMMVDFGTGRKTPQTTLTPAQYLTGAQHLYGIWDWNMAGWNANMSAQFASLTAPQTVTIAQLQPQLLTLNAADNTLDVTNNPVCWSGSATCPGGPGMNTQFGFRVRLPGTNEQLIFNPLMYQNTLIVNTTIPAVNTPTSCQIAHDTGNTIALSISTGGVSTTGPGGTGNNFFKNTTDTNAAGSLTNGTGTPFIVLAGGNAFLLTQSLGDGTTTPPSGPGPPLTCTTQSCTGGLNQTGPTGKRLTWIQRR